MNESCLSGSKQRNGERPVDIDIGHDYLVTILTLILFVSYNFNFEQSKLAARSKSVAEDSSSNAVSV